MRAEELNTIRDFVRQNNPLIHSITNPISINQCANAVLAVGARPIMAEHPEEVGEITETVDALLVNIGNITDVRMKSIMISSGTAKEKGILTVLDAVGVACSKLRRDFAINLIQTNQPTVIKGNYSEIMALNNADYKSQGVDSQKTLECDYVSKIAMTLAKKYNAIILASGKTDIVCDGLKTVYINNGTSRLASVTGTGCMLGVLCATYLSAKCDISAIVTACAVLGICGEFAKDTKGNASFMTNLMDNLSVLTDSDLKKYLKVEVEQ